MFGRATRRAAGAALAAAVIAPAAHASEVLSLDLANPVNGTSGGVAAQSQPLVAGGDYVVTISGTGSLWSTNDPYYDLCGLPEPGDDHEPLARQPDTPPTIDAAFVFAAPVGVGLMGGSACSEPNATTPPVPGLLLMGTHESFAPAVPIGGPALRAGPDAHLRVRRDG